MSRWWCVRLTRYARPPIGALAGVVSLLAIASALDVLKPWPIKLLVDHVLRPAGGGSGESWLGLLPGAATASGQIGWLAGAGVLLFALAQAARVLQAYLVTGLGGRMNYALGAALLERMQELTLTFHTGQRVGDLVRRVVTDSACVRDLYCAVLIPAAAAVVSLAAMFVVMFRLDPLLAIVALSFAAPLAALIGCFARPMSQRSYEQQQQEGRLLSLAEQTLSAIPVVQTFAREAEHDRQFRALAATTAHASVRTVRAQLQFKILTGAVTATGMSTVMIIGGAHVLSGTLTVGGLLVFIAYLASLYAPLETLAYLSVGYSSAAAAARRALDVLESDQRVQERPGATALSASAAARGLSVQFERVTFGYQRSRPVLREIDLTIPPGQVTALVGPSGAGKTTLASLVLRLFDPWQGRVRVDGRDVRDLTLASLRQHISVVPQEPLLLPLSVAQNIAYGRPGASLSEIRQAAEVAGAAEFIECMPQGYETVLGERGMTLSAGQKQRLSIARALLRDTPVLILDEPTSALDAQTERAVVDAMARLMRGRTCLIIAHRLTTIQHAQVVVVLSEGRIVEVGAPAELRARQGVYHRMWAMQDRLVHAVHD